VGGSDKFPETAEWSQKIRLYDGAAESLNKTLKDGKPRYLVAFVRGGGFVNVDSTLDSHGAIRIGGDAQVVAEGIRGGFTLSEETVGGFWLGLDVKEVSLGFLKRVAGASVLKDSAFLKEHDDKALVFSTRGASTLIGKDREFKATWYLAGDAEGAGSEQIKKENAPVSSLVRNPARLESRKRS
jgi:hypothetical protein